MWINKDQKDSEYGHFSESISQSINLALAQFSLKLNYEILLLSRLVRIVASLERGIKKALKNGYLTSDIFIKTCFERPNKLAVVSADDKVKFTFIELKDLIFRIGNIFYDLGYRKGDVVALYMENRPEYVAIWLGLSILGVITSLINYNLRGDSLIHCIRVANAKAIIFSEETEG